MKLIVQPDHGVVPVLAAIDGARRSVEIVVFRLDVKDVTLAPEKAVTRDDRAHMEAVYRAGPRGGGAEDDTTATPAGDESAA